MSDGTLYIGTKRYSSWSLRGWLPVMLAGLNVSEAVIPLAGGSTPAVKATSPSGYVPYLVHNGIKIWDSLAIGEYCAEFSPSLWPQDRAARAQGRAISAEMHSGFRDLRMAMPMSLFRDAKGAGQTEGSLADIARIDAIWSGTRAQYGAGGPYLFGADFSVADAMYAPVVFRFMTYQPKLSTIAQDYVATMLDHYLMRQWLNEARAEPEAWYIPRMEAAPEPV
jgi:glutathione S-transferase